MLTKSEQAINNSYQIKEDFNTHSKAYRQPLHKSRRNPYPRGRSGSCHRYSSDEIVVYWVRLIGNQVEFEV